MDSDPDPGKSYQCDPDPLHWYYGLVVQDANPLLLRVAKTGRNHLTRKFMYIY